MYFVLESELGLGSIRYNLNWNHMCQEWRTRVDSIFDKMNSLKMSNTKWFSMARRWRASKTQLRWTIRGEGQANGLAPKDQGGGEERVKALRRWTVRGYVKLWMIHINHMKNQEEMEWRIYGSWQPSRFERKKRYLKAFKCSKWFKRVLSLNLSIGMPHY